MKQYKSWFIGSVLIAMLLPMNSYAAEPYTIEKTYTTTDPEQPVDFDEEIKVHGKTYRLSNVEKEILEDNAKEESIVITSPPYVNDDPDYIQVPDQEYQEEGKTYVLYSYHNVDVMVEDRTKEVSSDITYSAVEQADRIPDTGIIEVTDEATGNKKEVTLPLKTYEYNNYRWSDDFEFPITVQDYDAEFYALGNELVPKREEQPFQGFEIQLLNSMSLDPDYYQIETTEWISEPYTTDGIWFRNAIARGKKQVADLTATYGGLVTLDAMPGRAVEATYYPKQVEYQMKATATYHRISFWDFLKDLLAKFFSNPLYVSVALILILLLVIIILFLISRKRKNHKSNDKNTERG